jgi:hypothetical protein
MERGTARHVQHGDMRNAQKILTGKPEEKTPLAIPRYTWQDTITINFREAGCECGLESPGSGQGGTSEYGINTIN